jgi:microcystin-dependent protein
MPNPIKPKRSYTATNTPTLTSGELGINATDGKIWIGNAAGNANVLVSSLARSDHTGTLAITSGGTGQTTANAAANAILPAQASNSGKYLTTNGTDSSWGTVTAGTTLPSGSMQMFAGAITQSAAAGVVTTNAPSGWLLANGDIVSRSTYSALFTAIGTTYGAGNGSTTFALPDMRSRVPVGVGQASGLTNRTLGGTVGTEGHTVASSNISQFSTGNMSANATHVHSHIKPMYCYNPNITSAGLTSGNYVMGNDTAGVTPVASASTEHTHTIGSASPTSISNMQPSIGMNYIIKT